MPILLYFVLTFFSIALVADLKSGDKAPDFSLKAQDGKNYTLADFKDKWLALYFYPKDNTPGCTKQAENIRDGQTALTKAGIVVLGVSVDNLDSHKKFASQKNLNYPILSDDSSTVTKAYGVNAFYGLAKRHTVIIKPDQTIGQVITDVDVNKHTGQIIEAVKKLQDK